MKSKNSKNLDVEENPFIETLTIIPGRKTIDYNTYMKNKAEYDSTNSVPYMYYESSDKISFYTSPSIRKILSKLSGSAVKLLIWIMQSIDYGGDFIKFNANRFLKETEMSTSTLQKAKEELINNQIIAPRGTDRKSFWINPVIMFKGSRTKKYPDKVALFKSTNPNITSDSKIN